MNFEDFRYPIDTTTFARPEFDADKATGAFDVNLGRLPILQYSGAEGTATLGQSKSIERFVAQKLGLFGSNAVEAAQIDMIAEHVRDIKQKYNDAKVGKKDQELTDAKDKFIKEDLPSWFGKLDKTLSGTAGFAVGDKISLADVTIHHIVKDYFDDLAGAAAAASAFPRIVSSVESVSAAAQTWFDSRPVTKF